MKIENIEFIVCQEKLATPTPLSCGVLTHRNFGLVRVQTSSGIDGWGETSVNFPPWTIHERKATIEQGLAPLLVGEDPRDIRRLWEKMINATRSYTRMWAEGAIMQAISGVDMALWDFLGKDLGQPLWRLIGGRQREEVPIYATGVSTDDLPRNLQDLLNKGFETVKIRIGFDVAQDLENLRTAREVIGPDKSLMIDANQAYTLRQAYEVLPGVAEVDPYWMEEPILSDDLDGYRYLKSKFPDIKLAWGENAFTAADYIRMGAVGAPVDYVMPDPCRSGGVTGVQEILHWSDRVDMPVSLHHYGSDLGFAAALQIMATQRNIAPLLRDVSGVQLRDDIIETPIDMENGSCSVPNNPGLGVALNMTRVEETRLKF